MAFCEASYWLACLAAPEFKRAAAKQLLWRWCVQGARSADGLYSAQDQELTECGLDATQLEQFHACQALVAQQAALLAQLEIEGINLITRADTAYPETLTQRLPEERLPYLLYYRGNLDLLNLPGISLAGAGLPSEAAQTFVRGLVKQLAQQECVFIGGFENGVDRLGIETALNQGVGCVLVLPLGLRAFGKVLPNLEACISTGKLLVLSPYACDTVYSERLASARLPVIAGLSEMLLAIEPDNALALWVQTLQAQLPRLGVWTGSVGVKQEFWLAQGVLTFTTAEEVQHEWLKALGETSSEPASPSPTVNTAAERAIAFVDADSAIETLRQSGAVPDVLARRLRERAPEWNK